MDPLQKSLEAYIKLQNKLHGSPEQITGHCTEVINNILDEWAADKEVDTKIANHFLTSVKELMAKVVAWKVKRLTQEK